ncbi:hypothetical protein UC8_42880 [Roseimaritima ulvae]|uniref:Uncharacterized protein n=1 Tax=Roseimaritima ulvae TaxID=980254 RepID=A0A5B9QTA7_9BACT|nr:hypothetical protein UC8_42880 [Roseimaritima ulvae]
MVTPSASVAGAPNDRTPKSQLGGISDADLSTRVQLVYHASRERAPLDRPQLSAGIHSHEVQSCRCQAGVRYVVDARTYRNAVRPGKVRSEGRSPLPVRSRCQKHRRLGVDAPIRVRHWKQVSIRMIRRLGQPQASPCHRRLRSLAQRSTGERRTPGIAVGEDQASHRAWPGSHQLRSAPAVRVPVVAERTQNLIGGNGRRHRAARVKQTIRKRADAAPVHGIVTRRLPAAGKTIGSDPNVYCHRERQSVNHGQYPPSHFRRQGKSVSSQCTDHRDSQL